MASETLKQKKPSPNAESVHGERLKSPVTPLTQRPTRERKRPKRYISPIVSPSSVTKSVSVEHGRGARLNEIPNVAYKLSKRKPDDNLFLLHTILYGKKGKAKTLKRDIGQFSGFVWSEQEEKQRARAKDKLEKFTKEKLVDFCNVLDISINKSNVKKEEVAASVVEFLVNPKATRDVILAHSEKESKKRKKSTPKDLAPGESSDVKAKVCNQIQTTKESGKTQQDQPYERGSDKEAVGSKDTNGSQGEDDVAPEKESEEDEKDKAEESKDQGEDIKEGEAKPTRKELLVEVAKILKEVDFDKATLMDIVKRLGSHFGVSLVHRKLEVKDIISDAISLMTSEMSDRRREKMTLV
ncbi:unnamed protein product [Cochlearia groenlandica]